MCGLCETSKAREGWHQPHIEEYCCEVYACVSSWGTSLTWTDRSSNSDAVNLSRKMKSRHYVPKQGNTDNT